MHAEIVVRRRDRQSRFSSHQMPRKAASRLETVVNHETSMASDALTTASICIPLLSSGTPFTCASSRSRLARLPPRRKRPCPRDQPACPVILRIARMVSGRLDEDAMCVGGDRSRTCSGLEADPSTRRLRCLEGSRHMCDPTPQALKDCRSWSPHNRDCAEPQNLASARVARSILRMWDSVHRSRALAADHDSVPDAPASTAFAPGDVRRDSVDECLLTSNARRSLHQFRGIDLRR